MIKRYFLGFCLSALVTGGIQAQNYTISPNDTVYETYFTGGLTYGEIFFENNLAAPDSLKLEWYMISTTFDTLLYTAPEVQLCDYDLCFIGWKRGRKMDLIPPGVNGRIKLQVPTLTAGSYSTCYRVREWAPTAFAWDTICFQFTFTVDIENQLLASEVNVAPNPANESIQLTATGSALPSGKVELTDIMGRTVGQWDVTATPRFSLETSSFTEGVYVLRYSTQNASFSEKVVIQH